MIRRIDTDDECRLREFDDPVELALGKPRRNRGRRCADLPCRDRGRDEFDAVGEREHHDVVLPHAERGERLGGIDREPLELGAVDGSGLVRDCRMRRIGGSQIRVGNGDDWCCT